MAQDARPSSLPHSLAALVLLLCVATGTMAHLAASTRPGVPSLPGGLAVEMPLLAAASVLSPVGALVLDELLGMPLPDLVSPAVLMVSAAGLLLAGGGPARSAPPNRVARRMPGRRSLRPGSGLDLGPAWPRRARSCGRPPSGRGSAASPG